MNENKIIDNFKNLNRRELMNLLNQNEIRLENKQKRIKNLRITDNMEKIYCKTCCLGTLSLTAIKVFSNTTLIDNGFLTVMFANSIAFIMLIMQTHKKIKKHENDVIEINNEIENCKQLLKRYNCNN